MFNSEAVEEVADLIEFRVGVGTFEVPEPLGETLETLRCGISVGGLFPDSVVTLGQVVLVASPPDLLQVAVDVQALEVGDS